MISLLKKLWNDRSGNALVITAAALPVLIGMAGLATDTIQWTLWKRQLQRAADSAAIAGVYTLSDTDDETAAATAVCDDIARTIDRDNRTMADVLEDCPTPLFPADDDLVAGAEDQVEVVLQVQKQLAFSSLFMTSAPLIQARARAASFVQPGTEYCVVALEPTGTGISVTGSTNVDMGECSLISNSTNATAAASNGTSQAVSSGNNSNITAAALNAVGFVQYNSNWDVDSYNPGSTALPDPYDSLDVPPQSECDKTIPQNQLGTNRSGASYTYTSSGGSSVTLAPPSVIDTDGDDSNTDVAGQIVCITGSISLTGHQKLALGPATYVMNGGDLGMNSTNAYLGCRSCTIAMTNYSQTTNVSSGNISITGGTLDLRAPTTNPNPTMAEAYDYTGIALMQDPDTSPTTSGTQSTIQGNNGTSITGVIYMPTRGLTYTGGSSTASACLQIVARRVVFTGNSSMQIAADCVGTGISAIQSADGARRIRLVA